MSSDNSSLAKRINSNIESAAVIYSQNTTMRTAISLIPGIGSTIDLILSSGDQKIQTGRINSTISNLRDEMSKIDVSKIDKKFLDSEEFYDLMMQTFERCSRTRHVEKVILYCKILAHSVLIENLEERSSAEDFIGFIDELSFKDIKLGLKMYEQQKDIPEKFDSDKGNTELKFAVEHGWHDLKTICQLTEVEFRISLGKLARTSLIKEIIGTYVSYPGGIYVITPTFQRLMNFIQLGTATPLFNYYVSRTLIVD
jgi:hypothetical protein